MYTVQESRADLTPFFVDLLKDWLDHILDVKLTTADEVRLLHPKLQI